MITLKKQLDCARRELALRHSVYPVWVGKGKITQERADYELVAMASIIDTLEKLVMLEDVSIEMRGPIPAEFNRVSAPMLADGSGFKTVAMADPTKHRREAAATLGTAQANGELGTRNSEVKAP